MASTRKSEPEITPAEPTDDSLPLVESATPPAEDKPITMKDVAALQGIGAGPDASNVRAITERDAHEAGVFISAGMKSDIDSVGWCRSPVDGTVIASAETFKRIEEARKQ